MKQSLQLKIGQQLTMTPQLQQAIRLLQLSSLDLQQEIQEALDNNYMLEIDETQDTPSSGTETSNAPEADQDKLLKQIDLAIADQEQESNTASEDQQVNFDDDRQNNIPEDLPTDMSWEEVFTHNSITPASTPGFSDKQQDMFENTSATQENIQEFLLSQIALLPLSDEDRAIAEVIIDSIDDSGYLRAEVEELTENFAQYEDIGEAEITAVLHMIQQLEPPGVGARNLQENLLLQMRQLPPDTPWLAQAQRLVERYLHLLAGRDYNSLRRRMKLSEQDMIAVVHLIRSLNPRPGGQITRDNLQYIVPDIIVKKVNGIWHAELNPDIIPPLTINQQYLQLSKQVKNEADVTSMKEHLQEARWFIKSVQSRHDTLLKVARCILSFQQDFFNYGEEYMKALVLADVAEKVGMHESTISRVTTQKYMHTPKGIFELKYFFSSHVSTASGGEASATAIRAVIKKLVEAENKRKPYSDNKLSQLLAQQNYKVARRTVAKYREALGIPPSNERKSLT